MKTSGFGLILFPGVLLTASAVGGEAINCLELEQLDLHDTVITSTRLADADANSGWPAHCVVEGAVEGRIRLRARLPVAGDWNGRFMMGGGGGFVGLIQNHALGPMAGSGGDALSRGYATVATDTGHRGHPPETALLDASWALDNLPGIKDWGYRAVPKVADAVKRLIEAHYGEPATHNYFLGCSNGGRQAMKAAQLNPHLFDGIIAMAPAFDWTGIMLGQLAIAHAMFPDGDRQKPVLSEADVKTVAEAVDNHCDDIDGIADGIISDPASCEFDPREALPDFSDAQLRAVEAVYEGVEIEGRQFHPGFPPGSEAAPGAWDLWFTGSATPQWFSGASPTSAGSRFVLETFRYLAANDSTIELSDLTLDTALVDELRFIARIASATNPDLTNFRDAGGKLLIIQGLADHALPAGHTKRYYERVSERMGAEVDEFMRLFLLPGVTHCAGGDGPDRVDMIDAIERWVENEQPPQALQAVKFDADGEMLMARPVCPYPQQQHHDGEGDATKPGSFECRP